MSLRGAVVLAAGALVFGAAPASAQDPGSFNQLSGRSGCIAQIGADVGFCARASGLFDANAVAVSPDQRHVYVASGGTSTGGSNALVTFTRASDDGSLVFAACISDDATDGRVGTDGRCADGDALAGANDLAISADGRFVYVSSAGSNSVAWFGRDAASGRLVQRGCIKEFVRGERCTAGLGIEGASGVGVSPDGTSVYVTGSRSGAIATFARDAATGALTQVQCISDSGSDGLCEQGTGLADASSVTVAPDGGDVYVSASSGAVTGYRRDVATGTLRSHVCLLDEAPDGPCRTSRALAGASDVALSPDGRSVFVASQDDSALAILARDPQTGELTADDCFADDDSFASPPPPPPPAPTPVPPLAARDGDHATARAGGTRGCRTAKALDQATSVTVSANGQAVYVVSPGDYLAAFRRFTSTGRLEQFACAEDVVTHDGCVETRGVSGATGVAATRDGRNLYLANPANDLVAVFAATIAIASRSAALRRDGSIRLRLGCPGARREGCAGRLTTRLASRRRVDRGGGRYRLRAGETTMVRVRLGRAAKRRVVARGRAVLQVAAHERHGKVRATARRVLVR
jgi:6-phosphogluconolactonase (cycloisomerase 2 family)